jgi:hypothetical protein
MSLKSESDPHGKDPHSPGAKLDSGKVRAGLLLDFSRALMAVAEVSTHGAEKYSPGGWLKVPDAERRYTDAAWRHSLKGNQSEMDPDSGLLHQAHQAWNVLAALEIKLRHQETVKFLR